MDHTRPSTLSDVAVRAGVSVATASRVLNGSPHRVSEPLAQKVRQIAVELRYAPNAQAQWLARSASSVVAVLLHDITDPYFGQIAQGILAEAAHRDIRVVLSQTGNDPQSEAAQLADMRVLRPRAVVMLGSRTGYRDAEEKLSQALTQLHESGAAVASVGQPGLPGSCVSPQNRAGATALAKHLVSQGHRQFTVVGGPEVLQVVAERREGFIDGLPTQAGVDVISAEFTRDGGYAAGQEFCQVNSGATAVFVTSDVMASGFCRALREAGRAIPEEISVAGFDDVPVAADLYPPLTTVRLPLSEMGTMALRMALDNRSDEVVSVAGELVVRGSTGQVRSV